MKGRSKVLFASLSVDLTSPCHAYFSREAALLYGTGIWVDTAGREVQVTCVDPDRERLDRDYEWKDRVYVGIVVRRVRDGFKGEHEFRFIYAPYFPE